MSDKKMSAASYGAEGIQAANRRQRKIFSIAMTAATHFSYVSLGNRECALFLQNAVAEKEM